jgi:hypothetical protein
MRRPTLAASIEYEYWHWVKTHYIYFNVFSILTFKSITTKFTVIEEQVHQLSAE